MEVKKIYLKNFRKYFEKEIYFEKGLNIIIGDNAVGKTTIVEAIYFFAIGKSIRTKNNKELINLNKNYTYFFIEYEKNNKTEKIEIYLDNENNKKMILKGKEIKKVYDLISNINVIYFSPDEIKLIKDGPSERRRFMDICISQYNKTYFKKLIIFNNLLKQRNAVLKERIGEEELKKQLYVWDKQIIEAERYIVKQRNDFIFFINNEIKNFHNIITDGKEKIEINYESLFKGDNFEEIENKIKTEMIKNFKKDILNQYTNTGIHKDDIEIKINNEDIRKYGSQGQQRTATLSLKLAEAIFLEKMTKEKPIIILDDVLSELDKTRQNKLIEILEEYQTIITTTDKTIQKECNEIKIL